MADNALFKVKYGLKANLPAYSEANAGQILVTFDERAIYFDAPDNSGAGGNGVTGGRIRIGDFQRVQNLPEAAQGKTLEQTYGTELYFIESLNALAVAKGDAWTQINPDTGYTSISFSGGSGTGGAPVAGEVITGVSVNPQNARGLIFTVGKVAAANVTVADSDGKFTGTDVETVLAEIQGNIDGLTANDIVYQAGTSGAPNITVEDALDTLNNAFDDGGIVEQKISAAIGGLDGSATIATVTSGVVTIKAGVVEEDGEIDNSSDSDIILAKVATTGAANDVEYNTGVSVKDALDTLNGSDTTAGSVSKKVKDAVDALDVTEFALAEKDSSTNVVTIHGVKEIDGKVAVGTTVANDITLAAVAATGAAGDVAYSQTIGSTTVTNVDDALDALVTATEGGVASKTVYVVETAGSGSDAFSKRYTLYQGSTGSSSSPVAGEKLVDIDLAKDMVVSDGVCRQATAQDVSDAGANPGFSVGDCIVVLTIANNDGTKIYIPVNGLVDIYTAEASATQVQIAIDSNNEISATIVAGSIDTAELANSAVTTAKIADDAVTADKVAISAHTESQTAGADGIAVSVTTTDGQVSAVSASIAANTYEPYGAAVNAVEALDADKDATGTAQHSGTFVMSGVTQVDGLITSIDSVEVEAAGAAAALAATLGTAAYTASTDYDTAGAAAAVLGTNADAATANTVYGAKAAASAAQGDVDALETLVGTLPSGITATTVVGYIDEAVASGALEWGTF